MSGLDNSAFNQSILGDGETSSLLGKKSGFLNSTPDKIGSFSKEDSQSIDEGYIASLDISSISPVSRKDYLASSLGSPSQRNSVWDELNNTA